MDREQASEIKFFDASSRIGRTRYLAYPWGIVLLLLPALILAGLTFAMGHGFVGGLIFALAEIFGLVMSGVFIVRRLHDFGWSGWWSLIYWGLELWSLALTFHFLFSHPFGTPQPLGNYLPSLFILVYVLILVLVPGTQGPNRFGPVPPPNSTWVLVGAWMWLVVLLLAILGGIAVAAFGGYATQLQTAEAVKLAGDAEAPLTKAHKDNNGWPADLTQVYPKAAQDPVGLYVETVTGAATADGYAVVATLRNGGVARPVMGKSVEVWTKDGGQSWHCGPGGPDPVDNKYLPMACRDSGAP